MSKLSRKESLKKVSQISVSIIVALLGVAICSCCNHVLQGMIGIILAVSGMSWFVNIEFKMEAVDEIFGNRNYANL